jgi:hypothetical protein
MRSRRGARGGHDTPICGLVEVMGHSEEAGGSGEAVLRWRREKKRGERAMVKTND